MSAEYNHNSFARTALVHSNLNIIWKNIKWVAITFHPSFVARFVINSSDKNGIWKHTSDAFTKSSTYYKISKIKWPTRFKLLVCPKRHKRYLSVAHVGHVLVEIVYRTSIIQTFKTSIPQIFSFSCSLKLEISWLNCR